VYGKKKNNNIEITIIIPIHNEEQIIPELYNRLQNTVSQISKNYELIFVNDGSKDHSLLELIKLSEQDLRVFYINFSEILVIKLPLLRV
jgi:dolichol-phosphate mannosyltransferase